jgi:hypothetical protein
MILQCRNYPGAAEVALAIAIGQPCRDFAQVVLADWLAAQRAERLRSRSPAIHQDESHVRPPNERRDKKVTPMKRFELKKSVNLLQIEGSFANIEITDIFGIAASYLALEASAVPPSKAIAHR